MFPRVPDIEGRSGVRKRLRLKGAMQNETAILLQPSRTVLRLHMLCGAVKHIDLLVTRKLHLFAVATSTFTVNIVNQGERKNGFRNSGLFVGFVPYPKAFPVHENIAWVRVLFSLVFFKHLAKTGFSLGLLRGSFCLRVLSFFKSCTPPD